MTSDRTMPIQWAGRVFRVLGRAPAATLLLISLIAWLPGFLTLPPLDRDESRFAQASKQMAETGDLVDIRFSTGARYNKPIGIYWLQSASEKLFDGSGHSIIWHYRVPSLLGGYLALLLTYACARAFVGPPAALLSAALLGSTVLMGAEAQIATTDAMLLASILAAQAIFLRVYLAARDAARPKVPLWLVLCGWAAVGAGVLIKGPVILGVLAVTIVPLSIWDRDWRWLRGLKPLFGIPLAALIVAPWAIAIGFASHGAFYQQSLGHDFASKMLGGQESHGAPPGYFLALSSLTLWPATLLALPGLVRGFQLRREPAVRYLLVWSVASWIMFELVPTKLPHYVLPAYPALGMLGALWAMRPYEVGKPSRDRFVRYVAGAQFLAGTAALVIAPFLLARIFGATLPVWTSIVIVLCGICALAGAILFLRGNPVGGAAAAIVSSIAFFPSLTSGLAPVLAPIWTSPRAANLIEGDSKPGDPPVTLAGYVEPSLIFLLGTRTSIETGAGAADMAARHGGLALVEDRERKSFLDRASALKLTYSVAGRVSGFDYSRGHAVQMTLYRAMPAPRTPAPAVE